MTFRSCKMSYEHAPKIKQKIASLQMSPEFRIEFEIELDKKIFSTYGYECKVIFKSH